MVLDAPPATPSPDEPSPGRGRLHQADGVSVPFQGGRVTGRIPRTATQRPTVVVLEWERMGDPPARRPVRELGNGPTDLALLASALDRAASLVNAPPVAAAARERPSARPAHPGDQHGGKGGSWDIPLTQRHKPITIIGLTAKAVLRRLRTGRRTVARDESGGACVTGRGGSYAHGRDGARMRSTRTGRTTTRTARTTTAAP